MEGPGEHYAKWIKPVRGRQIPYDFTYMCNLMKKQTNKQNRDRLIDRKQDDSSGVGERVEVGGWRDWAKRKKDLWTWTTVRWLLRVGGIRGLNGVGKNTIKNLKTNKQIKDCSLLLVLSLSFIPHFRGDQQPRHEQTYCPVGVPTSRGWGLSPTVA